MNFIYMISLYLIYGLTFVEKINAQDHGIAPEAIPQVQMTKYCISYNSEDYRVKDCVKLTLTNDFSDEKKDCSITFTSGRPDYQLLLTFVQMDLAEDDKWALFDSNKNLGKFQNSGSFKHVEESEDSNNRPSHVQLDYNSSKGNLTLYYEGTPNEEHPGFTAIITLYKDPHRNGTCPSGHCMCPGRSMCIAENLQCNGYKNCGADDQSDELECIKLPDHTGQQDNPNRHSSAQNIGILVGGTASIVVLMVIVLVLLGIVCLRRMARQNRYGCEIRRPGDDIVVDADHVPPPPLCCRRHYPCPMHSNTFNDPPPPYSEHQQHRSAGQFDAPPYTPDGGDTAGLLNQSQGLSQDTPPAYRTLPPDFSQATANGNPVEAGYNTVSSSNIPPVAEIINIGSERCDASTTTMDLSSAVPSTMILPGRQDDQTPITLITNSNGSNAGLDGTSKINESNDEEGGNGRGIVTGAGQDLIMDSFEPSEPETGTREESVEGEGTDNREISTHFWRNPNTSPPFKIP